MERWRLIRSSPLRGGMNMAVDDVLLDEVASGRSAPVLRLYRWNSPTLTLGYGQRVEGRVDTATCRELGIEVVRRPTGGRAVLHDREATYAVISPERTTVFPGGVIGNYRVIAGVLESVVQSFGLAPEFAPVRGKGGGEGTNCFLAPSACELLLQGRKMTGSAQRRSAGAFLQHGSIPVEMDLERLHRVLSPGVPHPSQGIQELASRIGWLNRWLPEPVTIRQVEERLIAAFACCLGIAFTEEDLSSAEWGRARLLAKETYTNLAE